MGAGPIELRNGAAEGGAAADEGPGKVCAPVTAAAEGAGFGGALGLLPPGKASLKPSLSFLNMAFAYGG